MSSESDRADSLSPTTERAQADPPAGCCPQCGYNLTGLPETRCPECGEPFDAEYVANSELRSHLIPWERPELGGGMRRLAWTIGRAWFRPWAHFASAARRTEYSISGAGRFVIACIATAVLMNILTRTIDPMILFGRMFAHFGNATTALNVVRSSTRLTIPVSVMMDLSVFVHTCLAVMLIAVLLGMLYRRRLTALRPIDLVALFAPAIAFQSLVWSAYSIAISVHSGFLVLSGGALVIPPLYVLVLLYFGCRKLLSTGIPATTGFLLLFCAVQWAMGGLISGLGSFIIGLWSA